MKIKPTQVVFFLLEIVVCLIAILTLKMAWIFTAQIALLVCVFCQWLWFGGLPKLKAKGKNWRSQYLLFFFLRSLIYIGIFLVIWLLQKVTGFTVLLDWGPLLVVLFTYPILMGLNTYSES